MTLTPNKNQTVFIVHGGSPDELVHAEKFPDVPGIRQFILPKLDHNLSRSLKQNNQLHLLISAALGGHTQRFRRLIEQNDGLFLQRYLAASPPTFAPQPVAE